MFQLIYQSACRTGLTIEVLREIAHESVARNRERDVTGVMLVQGGRILQVLEGPEDAVRDLYATITRDTRHGGCTVLLTRHCRSRTFPNWQMGVCAVDDEDSHLVRLAVASLKARQRQRDMPGRRRSA